MTAAVAYQPTAYGFCLEMLPFCGSKGRKKERKQYFRQLGTHLNCIKDEILIDAGCGSGRDSKAFKGSGFEVCGIFITGDVREIRAGEKWVNAIARKNSEE